MEVRALTQSEQKYTYAQSMQLEGQTGCIVIILMLGSHQFKA